MSSVIFTFFKNFSKRPRGPEGLPSEGQYSGRPGICSVHVYVNGLVWNDYVVFIECLDDLFAELAAGAEILIDAVRPYGELEDDTIRADAVYHDVHVLLTDLRLAFKGLTDQRTDEVEV